MNFSKLLLVIFIVILPINTHANELHRKFHDWHLFRTQRGDREICYLLSTPIKQEGYFDRNGEPFFMVTQIPNDASEVTVSSGFFYDKSSDVTISFFSKKFYLFPFSALAWADNTNDDIDITKEMQKREDMVVTGVDNNGKIFTDVYSLIGFIDSYRAMRSVCKNLT